MVKSPSKHAQRPYENLSEYPTGRIGMRRRSRKKHKDPGNSGGGLNIFDAQEDPNEIKKSSIFKSLLKTKINPSKKDKEEKDTSKKSNKSKSA